jgi:hypothetical protein
VINFLKTKGFQSAKSRITRADDMFRFDLILRIHDIHYLVWHDNIRHFALAVRNEYKKGLAGGGFKEYNEIIIPKPIYTEEEAENLINIFNGLKQKK